MTLSGVLRVLPRRLLPVLIGSRTEEGCGWHCQVMDLKETGGLSGKVGMNMSRKSGWNIAAPLLVFFAVLGLYSLNWYQGQGGELGKLFGDVTTIAAERVQAGEIPYRDFWTMYAPGSYYLLALLFDLFGNHVVVGTIAASVFFAMAATVCYGLVRKLTGKILAGVVAAAIFSAAAYYTGYYLNLGPYPPAVFLVLLALYLMLCYYSTGKIMLLFAAGVVTGLIIVFKHDVGGYTAIAIGAGLLTAHLSGRRDSDGKIFDLLRRLTIYSTGALLLSLPVAIYFAVQAGQDMWQDLIVFPATDFRYARIEHYPSLIPGDFHHWWWVKSAFKVFDYIQYALPFLIFVLAVVALVIAVAKRRSEYLPMWMTFCCGYLLHYISAHVQVNTNVISMALYATLLGSTVYAQVLNIPISRSSILPGGVALLLAAGLFSAFFMQPFYHSVFVSEDYVESDLPKISGVRLSPKMNEVLTELVSFVDANVPPGNKIFIGLHRHDVTIVGDGKIYFILDRMNATRHDQLHPGIVNTAERQAEMIADLVKNDVSLVIKSHMFPDEALEKLKEIRVRTLPQTGARLLDEYIDSHYHLIRKVGQYEILLRNDPLPGPVQGQS